MSQQQQRWCYFHGEEHDESVWRTCGIGHFHNTADGVYAGKYRICDTLPGVPIGSKLLSCRKGYKRAWERMNRHLIKRETVLIAPPPHAPLVQPTPPPVVFPSVLPTPLVQPLVIPAPVVEPPTGPPTLLYWPVFARHGGPEPPPPPPLPTPDEHISSTAALNNLRQDVRSMERMSQENTQLHRSITRLAAENTLLRAQLVESNAAANRLRRSLAQTLGIIGPDEEEEDEVQS